MPLQWSTPICGGLHLCRAVSKVRKAGMYIWSRHHGDRAPAAHSLARLLACPVPSIAGPFDVSLVRSLPPLPNRATQLGIAVLVRQGPIGSARLEGHVWQGSLGNASVASPIRQISFGGTSLATPALH